MNARLALSSFSLAFVVLVFNQCSPLGSASLKSGVGNAAGSTATPVDATQPNVVPVSVGSGYTNEPVVTVTICQPGTSNCQSIPNVLLDTGSYGLRLFSTISTDNFQTASTSLLSLPFLADPAHAGQTLAECVTYIDGDSQWGPVATADVKLGGETASNVHVQVINANYARVPAGCTQVESGPLSSAFNGILGVGLFTADCGSGCAANSNNDIYFDCPSGGSGGCSGAAVAEVNQVSNPVASLPVDNNGVILEMASVPIQYGLSDGAVSAYGYLVLGIGTQSNNVPGAVATFPADGVGNFVTTFNGVTSSSSFIDSGSNALFFPKPSSLPLCSDNTYYCPASEASFTAVMAGASGQGSTLTVPFQVGNKDDMMSTSNPNLVFADYAGEASSDFDWGLPFFFGRNVYVQLDQGASTLGTGQLWAF